MKKNARRRAGGRRSSSLLFFTLLLHPIPVALLRPLLSILLPRHEQVDRSL
jgi:hypothetical protein